jgi:hypothetical protein
MTLDTENTPHKHEVSSITGLCIHCDKPAGAPEAPTASQNSGDGVEELLLHKVPSDKTKSGYEVTFDPVYLQKAIELLLTKARCEEHTLAFNNYVRLTETQFTEWCYTREAELHHRSEGTHTEASQRECLKEKI